MSLKVIVHTKTGKELVYYPLTGTESQELNWWASVLSKQETAVSFGRYVIAVSDIDFVETK